MMHNRFGLERNEKYRVLVIRKTALDQHYPEPTKDSSTDKRWKDLYTLKELWNFHKNDVRDNSMFLVGAVNFSVGSERSLQEGMWVSSCAEPEPEELSDL